MQTKLINFVIDIMSFIYINTIVQNNNNCYCVHGGRRDFITSCHHITKSRQNKSHMQRVYKPTCVSKKCYFIHLGSIKKGQVTFALCELITTLMKLIIATSIKSIIVTPMKSIIVTPMKLMITTPIKLMIDTPMKLMIATTMKLMITTPIKLMIDTPMKIVT